MTLNELKDKIIAQFGQMTIDDFLLDYQIATKIFNDAFADELEHRLKSKVDDYHRQKTRMDELIFEILKNKFNESTYEYFTKCVDKLNEEHKIIQKELSSPNKVLLVIDNEINEKSQQISTNQKSKEESQNIVKRTIKEISALEELAVDNTKYTKDVKNLEDIVALQNDKIEKFSLNIETLENESKELNVKREVIQETIANINAKIEKINSEITRAEDARKQAKEKTEALEYSALSFLCMVILHIEITKVKDDYFKIYSKVELSIQKKQEISFAIVLQFISGYLKKTEFTTPKKWRRILYEILANPIPDFLGMALGNRVGSKNCFISEKVKLTTLDSSFLLALKIALRSNHSLKTKNNKIVLGLSGGMTATISFRLKDVKYDKIQKFESEIYANYFFGEPYTWEKLYKQVGYADSEISIEIPYGYIILSKDYLIEISFSAAPVLLESSNIIRLAPNISSKAKQEDEALEEERALQIRKKEEDAYWESLDDDD
jgi:hypothetical protein